LHCALEFGFRNRRILRQDLLIGPVFDAVARQLLPIAGPITAKPAIAVIEELRPRAGGWRFDGLVSGWLLHDINDRWRSLTLSALCWRNCGRLYEGLRFGERFRRPVADAPRLKRALGGPSGRIFLNAAREIAGILEELVQRKAEREQPLDLGGRKRARQALAPQRRDFGVAALERGVEKLKRWRSAPAGEFIRASEQKLASLAAETRKRRRQTLSDGAGKRLGGRADEDHEIVPKSQERARERRRVYITGEGDHALAPRLGREVVERADRAAEIVLPAPDAVQIRALRTGA
jgi:hypothetical protein